MESTDLRDDDLLRSVSVVDGPIAERVSGRPVDGFLGDNVIVVSFAGSSGFDVQIHLRRGMSREDVATAFELAAQSIRE